MSTNIVAVAKSGVNVLTDSNPNDFIFHSEYNTFKIVATGLFEPTITHNTPDGVEYTVAHGRSYAPWIIAMMREAAINGVVWPNNFLYGVTSYLKFLACGADQTNLIFKIANTDAVNDYVAHIRWFILL